MSHKAFIERRRSDGGWVPVLTGGAVAPLEAIRVSGDAAALTYANKEMEFVLLDRMGLEAMPSHKARANVQGNAWLDIAAPEAEGAYTLVVYAPTYVWGVKTGDHEARATFRVTAKAPPPIRAPESTGPLSGILPDLGDVTGTLKAATPILLIVVGLVVLSQVKGLLK